MLLNGAPAQWGLDGLAYAPPEDPDRPEDVAPATDVRTLTFAGFTEVGRQLRLPELQVEAMKAIAGAYPRGSKERDTLTRRADRLAYCGDWAMVLECETHGAVAARRQATCDCRVCPDCAREKALETRERHYRALEKWPNVRHGMQWFMWTIPVQYESGVASIDRLQRDRKVVHRAWQKAWAVLQRVGNAKRAALHFEVSPDGLVHAHIIANHNWLSPDDFEAVKDAARAVLPPPPAGMKAAMVRCDPLRGGRKGIKEAVKYATKGGGKMGTHPLLCALLEAAWIGQKQTIWYGDWDGLDEEDEKDPATCPHPECGRHLTARPSLTREVPPRLFVPWRLRNPTRGFSISKSPPDS